MCPDVIPPGPYCHGYTVWESAQQDDHISSSVFGKHTRARGTMLLEVKERDAVKHDRRSQELNSIPPAKSDSRVHSTYDITGGHPLTLDHPPRRPIHWKHVL